jgi:hypothetical protein
MPSPAKPWGYKECKSVDRTAHHRATLAVSRSADGIEAPQRFPRLEVALTPVLPRMERLSGVGGSSPLPLGEG